MRNDNIYNTYNARHSSPSEVAESFIWSESFGKLVQNNHSVILGARGCGKTTLMKMLTIPALHSWQSSRAEDLRNKIPFYAIYISTDIYWNVKNKIYGSQLENYGSLSDQISRFSVNSNVFTSICDTFINIIELDIKDADLSKEVELCLILIKAWKLTDTTPTLRYVKESLNRRIDEVNQLIQSVIFNYKVGDELPYEDYFSLDFESSIDLILPIFERIYGLGGTKKWALCFDELEFAPVWLQKILFTSLRSRSQKLLYKLSSSPILSIDLRNSLLGDYSATSGNDVRLIKMWTSSDNEAFSKQLIQSLIDKDRSASQFLGSNPIYNKIQDSYVEGSDFYIQLTSLLQKDDSFKAFMSSKGVDLKKPIPRSSEEKDILYRKIKPIVYFRNNFIESNRNNSKVKYRSRKKTAKLYSGIEVLAKVCDGNPRWLIGIVTDLLVKNSSGSISDVHIYDELLSAAKRFKNVMANIPIGNNNVSIMQLIDRIGNHFKNLVLGNQFYMDPKGTFIVDESEIDITSNLIELLDKGISQGAFILLDVDDESFDFEIRGRRFKLSYLFSVLYDLPIRTYTSLKLSECLSNSTDGGANQISLFK